jgi:predicted CXXCH cytochrome family protein
MRLSSRSPRSRGVPVAPVSTGFSLRGFGVSRGWLLAAVLLSGLSACSRDDRIVYRDRAPFNAPADSGAFLGYYDVTTKKTTCGNCHVDYQTQWRQTRHANAYATLEASPAKEAYCYSCHSVTGNGNAAAGTQAGHDKATHATYRDVQCESCHGAGLEHVEGVGQGTVIRPLAKITMTGTGNCGDCHSGTHQPFAEDWAQSGHAVVNASRAGNVASGCATCHDGRKALEAWGVNASYQEKDGATSYQATTCAVCHNPHGSPNSAQLRFSVSSADPSQNLCMQCHMRRTEPSTSQSSPHAPQGAVLIGTAGYRPPGFVYDTARIFGTHATERNPRLCAGCHVTKFTGTDQATGAFTFQATGHLMRPVPCLDATGKPTGDKTCGYTTTARSWQSCASSGCHGNAAAAQNAFTTVRNRMKFLVDQLWIDSNGNGSLQAAPTDAGLLPTVRQMSPAQWSTTDNTITPAEGAEFNARLCGEYGQSNADNSKGVHNPFLCEALLIATINYIRSYYNLPAASAEVQAILDGPIGGPYSGAMRVSRTPVGGLR